MLSLRLYNRTLWNYFRGYRALLLSLRAMEIVFVAIRFLLIRAPLLIIWTRLPGLRGRKAPYPDLADIFKPARDRPGMLIHSEGGITLGDVRTKDELIAFMQRARKDISVPRATVKTIFGGVIRGVLTELGPTFLKLGQIVSMRPEMPPFLREELQIIQDALPPMKPQKVRMILDRELKLLGREGVDDVFEWVEWRPLASGSLAQVHRAKLRTGEEVALKVQRARLESYVVLDQVIITDFLLGWIGAFLLELRKTDLSIFKVSFRQSLHREIDFFLEGRTQNAFADIFSTYPLYAQGIKVAEVYFDYTTEKLLTMELVKNFHRVDRLAEMDPDKLWNLLNTKLPEFPEEFPFQVLNVICALHGDMSVLWGYMHGDPHLGNIYFLEPQDEFGWRVFLCDWGMVEEFPPHANVWMTNMYRIFMFTATAEKFDLDYMLGSLLGEYLAPIEVLGRDGRKLQEIARKDWSLGTMHEYSQAHLPRWMYRQSGPMWYALWRRRYTGADASVDSTHLTLQTRFRGATTFSREVLEVVLMGVKAPVGLNPFGKGPRRLHRVLPHYHWLMYKSCLYTEELSSTLWMESSWNDMYIHGSLRVVKNAFMNQLDNLTVVDMKKFIEDNIMAIWRQPELANSLLLKQPPPETFKTEKAAQTPG